MNSGEQKFVTRRHHRPKLQRSDHAQFLRHILPITLYILKLPIIFDANYILIPLRLKTSFPAVYY